MDPDLPTVDIAAASLADDGRRVSTNATGSVGLPREPGPYLWWVYREGAVDLARGLGLPLRAGPIYGGQAGATVRRRASAATLQSPH